MMTFAQFQATRTDCPDIGKAIGADMGTTEPVPGFLYVGELYIDAVQPWWPEKAREQGKYHLLIWHDEWISDDLEQLERRLYEFAGSEGYLD